MKKMLALVLGLAMALSANFALADQDKAEITVQGRAVVTADPDIVSVTANSTVNAKTVASAQEQIAKIIENVTTHLMELGVEQTDIVTTNYGYYPNYNYETDPPMVVGYQANHTLSITCRNVEMLDSVVGVVTDNGMSEIYGVTYGIADRSALYEQALDMAIEAAHQKAESMAACVGMSLSGMETLNENISYDADYGMNLTEDAAVSSSARGTGIHAGVINISASVTIVYDAQTAKQ